MKRKEWLFVALTLALLVGGGFGLYQYRMGQGTEEATRSVQQVDATQKQLAESFVQLWITRDFGATTMIAKAVPIEADDTVMDILTRHGNHVKTSYGGSFVESIDGLASAYKPGDASSQKLDWFYFVNGQMAEVGAREYPIQSGDVIWWDYHDWGSNTFTTRAQVAAFPHPFAKRGEETLVPLLIMAAKGYEPQAEKLAKTLESVRGEQVRVREWDEKLLEEEAAMILVADHQTVAATSFLQTMWSEKQAHGLYADVTKQGIVTYDPYLGKGADYQQPGVGLVLGSAHPSTLLPLWIVTGIGASGVERAVNALTQEADNRVLKGYGYLGLLLEANGNPVRLPIVQPKPNEVAP